MESVFKLYSVGVAAENKPRTTRTLNVVALEKNSAISGEVTFNPQGTEVSYKDPSGKTYNLAVTQDNTVPAEWFPAGSNRVTPPDIQRGEWVEIYRLGDTDRFYWRCMGLRDNLRTLETVIYAIAGNPKAGGAGIDVQNCYYVEWSTHEKHITVATSKANGEPFAYTFQINAGDGEINILDDIGNMIELISGENTIRATNASGSYLAIIQDKAQVSADSNISLICGGSTVDMTPGKVSVKTPVFEVTAGTITFTQG